MVIPMAHKMCDYTCMWNGLEDLYRNRSHNDIPDYFFFGLSAFCDFVFLNFSKSDTPKTVFWNDGRPNKMYAFMSEKVGFSHTAVEGRTFKFALSAVKKEIGQGRPVMIGALDMFYLEYLPKFYETYHIPIHFVLAVGYDDAAEEIFLYDCGREGLEKLSYENLEKAWRAAPPGLSKKNGVHQFIFDDAPKDVKSIFYTAISEKCRKNLNAKVNFVGVKGIRKLAKEILSWEKELDGAAYKNSLLHMVEYAGFPPSLGMRSIRHTGARLEFAGLLDWAAEEYQEELFRGAARLFEKSGEYIETLSFELLAAAEEKKKLSGEIKDGLEAIAEAETAAFQKIETATSLVLPL